MIKSINASGNSIGHCFEYFLCTYVSGNFPCLKIPFFKLINKENIVLLNNTAEEIIKQRRIENSNKVFVIT